MNVATANIVFLAIQSKLPLRQLFSPAQKILKETRQQEQHKTKTKDIYEFELGQLSFMHKLFLLALLDGYAQEHTQHQEFIDWEQIKYFSVTPIIYFKIVSSNNW